MPAHLRVLAGDCLVTDRADRTRTHRGHVVVLIKPDNTTLVHDADGYQPVAWLTRPESVIVEGREERSGSGREDVDGERRKGGDDDGGENRGGGKDERDEDTTEPFAVTARDGDRLLRVTSKSVSANRTVPVSDAGVPVGTCPADGSTLVRARGDVVCADCGTRWSLPRGASVTDTVCESCCLPNIRVERGEPFHLCLDPSCDPLDDAVRERFDRVWSCPNCGDDLTVRTAPGRQYFACANDPACDTTFSVPNATFVDECGCGLPLFESSDGRRCLDRDCEDGRGSIDG